MHVLNTALARQDPLFVFDWNIVVNARGTSVDISSMVEEITVPPTTFDSDTVFRFGTHIKMVKSATVSSVNMKVYEDQDMKAMQFFADWHTKAILRPRGIFNPTKAYKGSILVTPLNVKGNPIKTIKMEGAYPERMPSYSATSENGRVILDVDFSVDSVTLS